MGTTEINQKLKRTSKEELDKILEEYQKKCQLYRHGRNFGMGLYPLPVALDAYLKFADTNMIYAGGTLGNPFLGVSEMEIESIKMMSTIFNGDDAIKGNITFGGSESNILAIKAAREKAREEGLERGKGRVIMPDSAHPSLIKACHLLDLEVIRTASTEKYEADPKIIRDNITEDTVAIVSTCGTHTVGTIDPIEEIGRIANDKGIWHHVDAAWGGFISCWLRMAGKYDIPKFDFEIEGVTSITVDPHKMLFAPMPAGGILYRNSDYQKHAFFDFDDELGIHGHYFTTTFAGSRTGGNMAATYALLKHYGAEGYTELALKCMDLTYRMVEGVKDIPGLEIPIKPKMNLFAVASETLDVNKISDQMRDKGWYGLYTTKVPPSFRVVLLPQNEPHIEAFLKDLRSISTSSDVRL